MSAKNTALAMWTAGWIAALSQPNNHLIANTISYWKGIADLIIEKTGNFVDWVLNTSHWTTSAILTPLAALYWWVKAGEFIDEKIFKFENKWLKWASKVWWGLVWLSHMPTAAVVWTWIWAWKAWTWAVKWLWNGIKSLWNKGYSNNTNFKKEKAA